MSEKKPTVVTPEFRVNFPNLFEATKEGKFGLTMMFEKSTDLTALKKLIKDTATAKWGAKLPANLDICLKDGDTKKTKEGTLSKEKYPIFAGKIIANASTKFQPEVVGPDKQDILVKEEIYSGCYARAVVTAYPWEKNGGKGVNLNVLAVQKTRDGEKLAPKRIVSDAFSTLDVTSSSESNDVGLDDI